MSGDLSGEEHSRSDRKQLFLLPPPPFNSVVLNGGASKEMDCWAEYGDK